MLLKTTCKIFLGITLIIMCISCEKPVPPDNNGNDNDTTEVAYNSDYMFDMQTVSEIRLDIEPAEWNKFLGYFDQNEHNEECVPAKFTYKKGAETFTLDKVGVRLRGNTSRRRPEGWTGENHNAQNPDWHHCHFVVKFQEYKDNVLFCENDRVTLKWFKDDAAYCREVYCYDLFRRFGVYTAPRVAYTRLTINVLGDPKPAYFGVYVLLEGV
ncbi:MAG: CotH kinase family protein, partial [Prevotellaceae bacterium]|nr:CotH kinase family protein [Prevotellaceae bacterium]